MVMHRVRKVHLGIIGCGGIAKRHIRGHLATPDVVEIVAVCDVVKEVAEASARELGVKRVYTDYNKLVVDPEVDAVDVLTPVKWHAPMTVAACEAGRHVLVQKPFAITLEEADQMVRAARRAGVKLMGSVSYIFFPPIWKLRELIDAGELGETIMLRTKIGYASGATPGHSYMKGGWRSDPLVSGGGFLMDDVWHHIYTSRWLMGEFEKVSAIIAQRDTDFPREPYLIDDAAFLMWKYRGVDKWGVADGELYGPFEDLRFEVTGTKGLAIASFGAHEYIRGGNRLAPLVVFNRDETKYYCQDPTLSEGYRVTNVNWERQSRHFAACILEDREPIFTGEDGRRVLEICRAAYKSSEEGRVIILS